MLNVPQIQQYIFNFASKRHVILKKHKLEKCKKIKKKRNVIVRLLLRVKQCPISFVIFYRCIFTMDGLKKMETN